MSELSSLEVENWLETRTSTDGLRTLQSREGDPTVMDRETMAPVFPQWSRLASHLKSVLVLHSGLHGILKLFQPLSPCSV